MIQAYSKRLLSPFTGQVQIVETETARALTLDGKQWAIQYKHVSGPAGQDARSQQGKTQQPGNIRVAHIENSVIERVRVPSFLDTDEIDEQIRVLSGYLGDITLPLPAADMYEFWLLDEKHEAPLALIYSCVKAEEMPLYPFKPEWTALSAARMEVARTPEEQQHYVPPVNYRLQQLVTERAGRRPRAAWIRRRENESGAFPPCLLSEDWEEEAHCQLCQRYLRRLAPRLLMLHGLDRADRQRLEVAAQEHAIEVEQFYPLYPEIADEELMAAIRVEARLRRASPDA